MKLVLKVFALLLAVLLLGASAVGTWYLTAAVTVNYDERGVPHIRAENESDLYRALGYVHAQDRLFQMEIIRRLAQG
jgi:penicillin amidase